MALTACGGGTATDGDPSNGPSTPESTSSPDAEPTETEDQEELSITIATYPILVAFPWYVAQQEGLFAEENLVVDSVDVASGPAATQALIAREADVMANSLDNALTARHQDIDLVSVAGILQSSYLALIVSKDVELPDPLPPYPEVIEVLRGLDLGVVARGTPPEFAASQMLEDAGMDPASDVAFVPVGLPNTAIDAFRQGTVQAGVWFEPMISMAVAEDLVTVLVDLREGEVDSFDWQYSGWIGLRENVEENREAMVRFGRVMEMTYEFMQDPANFDVVVQYASEFLTGGNQELAETLMDTNLKYLGTAVDASSVEKASDFLIKAGIIDEPVDPADYLIDLGG